MAENVHAVEAAKLCHIQRVMTLIQMRFDGNKL